MAEISKVRTIGDVIRPNMIASNKYQNDINEYDENSPDLISPLGKDENPATGETGNLMDIISRNKMISMNEFSKGNREYNDVE